ncbi:MAG: hypothetical protein ACE5I5_18580, partial [Candidatus Heimdallarchaeota archaeon]
SLKKFKVTYKGRELRAVLMSTKDLLRQLFVKRSLKNNDSGFQLQFTNPLFNATIVEPAKIIVKSETVEKETYKDFQIETESGSRITNKEISKSNPFHFLVNANVTLYFVRKQALPVEKYTLTFTILSEEFGELKFRIKERNRG